MWCPRTTQVYRERAHTPKRDRATRDAVGGSGCWRHCGAQRHRAWKVGLIVLASPARGRRQLTARQGSILEIGEHSERFGVSRPSRRLHERAQRAARRVTACIRTLYGPCMRGGQARPRPGPTSQIDVAVQDVCDSEVLGTRTRGSRVGVLARRPTPRRWKFERHRKTPLGSEPLIVREPTHAGR